MKVFISHARQDSELAARLAAAMRREGLEPWLAQNEILPGDNWAERVSQALNESQAMVVLLTPAALNSATVLGEIQFALGRIDYRQRLVPVWVGPAEQVLPESVPWILRRIKIIRMRDADEIAECVKRISHALAAAV